VVCVLVCAPTHTVHTAARPQDFLTSVRRFYSNAYTDADKQVRRARRRLSVTPRA